jgi:hypothetical protein
MLNGDQGWPVRAVHAAGLLLLLAFAIAFALSAFAAKPKPSPANSFPKPPVELSALLQAAMVDAMADSPRWRDLESRLNVRWLRAAEALVPPIGVTPAAVGRQAAALVQIGGRLLPFAFQLSGQSVEGWSVALWGSADGPSAMELRGGDQCTQPCTPALVNAEQALMNSGMRFMIECETRAMQVLRLAAQGRRDAFLVHYRAEPGRDSRLLLFWNEPPDVLLKQDGCALLARQR